MACREGDGVVPSGESQASGTEAFLPDYNHPKRSKVSWLWKLKTGVYAPKSNMPRGDLGLGFVGSRPPATRYVKSNLACVVSDRRRRRLFKSLQALAYRIGTTALRARLALRASTRGLRWRIGILPTTSCPAPVAQKTLRCVRSPRQ